MATLKQRLHRKNSSGVYDTIHYETDSSVVLMADGTTLEAKMGTKANTSHNHSASQITSGTLPVARGGTGVTSIDALKSALGITPAVTPSPDYPNIPNLGMSLSWCGYSWIVVYKNNGTAVLTTSTIVKIIPGNFCFSGSFTESECHKFAVENKFTLCDYIIPWRCGKVFLASKTEMSTIFNYFDNNSKRICKYNGIDTGYWLSSSYVYGGGGEGTSYVDQTGRVGDIALEYTYDQTIGFRPFIAIMY